MDRNINRNILRIDKTKVGESILIEDLRKEFPNINSDDFLSIISKLASRYYIRIDGKYAHECYNIEKYNRIVGLDRDGLVAMIILKTKKFGQKWKTA